MVRVVKTGFLSAAASGLLDLPQSIDSPPVLHAPRIARAKLSASRLRLAELRNRTTRFASAGRVRLIGAPGIKRRRFVANGWAEALS